MGDLTYLSARWDDPTVTVPEAALSNDATLLALDRTNDRTYAVVSCPRGPVVAEQNRRLVVLGPGCRTAGAESLPELHALLSRMDADLAECDAVMALMYERGEDYFTGVLRDLEALRDRLALLDIPEYGDPEARLLDDVLDLLRTHALPEDHPLANR